MMKKLKGTVFKMSLEELSWGKKDMLGFGGVCECGDKVMEG